MFSSVRWSYKPSFKKFLGANFELNDLIVNFVPFLPIFGISLRLKREVQKFSYSYFTVVFSSVRWSYKPSFKKFLGANFELNDLIVNFVPFLPIFGISLRLKREVQKFSYSYFTLVFSIVRWSYKPSFKKFLGANFELNDLIVNFVPFLPIFGISLRLKREVQKFSYSYFTVVFSSVRWSYKPSFKKFLGANFELNDLIVNFVPFLPIFGISLRLKREVQKFSYSYFTVVFSSVRWSYKPSFKKFLGANFELNDLIVNFVPFLPIFGISLRLKREVQKFSYSYFTVAFSSVRWSYKPSFKKFLGANFELNDLIVNFVPFLPIFGISLRLKREVQKFSYSYFTVVFSSVRWSYKPSFKKFLGAYFELNDLIVNFVPFLPIFGISLRLKREVQKFSYSYFTVVFSSVRWSYQPSFKKFLGANFELNDLIVNFVPFLPIFGISLRLKREVQKFSYSYFTVVFSSVRWSYKPSFKKFLGANFELNDLIVNFVPFLPIFGIYLRLKREVQKFSYSYFTVVFSSVRWSYKPSFKKFLGANFELNDLIVNFVPFLPIFGISLRLKREVQKFSYSYFTVAFSSVRWSYKPSFKKFLGANFELNDLIVNFVPFLPIFGISLRLKREVQKFSYSYFTVVFSSVRWSYKPSFKKFLGANFELNDLIVNFVPFLPIFGISLRLKREVQKFSYSYFTVVFSSVRWSYKPSFKKFLGANFELNDLIVNFVPFLPIFGISLRLKREVQKFSYSYFTVVFSSVRWSYKPSFKKFLGVNFELNDFVPLLYHSVPLFEKWYKWYKKVRLHLLKTQKQM